MILSGHHEDDTDFLTEESLRTLEGGERALSKYVMDTLYDGFRQWY